MNTLKSLFGKVLSLPPNNIFLVFALGVVGCLCGVALGLYDIGSTSLFLNSFGTEPLAVALIGAAVLMAFTGYYVLLFDRRQGYGCVPVLTAVFAVMTILIVLVPSFPVPAIAALFSFKYSLSALFLTAFWSLAGRFIPIRFDSLKYTAVLLSCLLGFGISGIVGNHLSNAIHALEISIPCAIGALAVMLYLVHTHPVDNETFVKKQGGTQGILGNRLIRLICLVSFIYMAGRSALDICFFKTALQTANVQTYVSSFFALFGFLGMLCLVLLRQTHYLYTVTAGLYVLCFSIVGTAVTLFFGNPTQVLICYLLFQLTAFFYVALYFKILPRPLPLARKARLKKIRLLLIQPTGFMASAILFHYAEDTYRLSLYTSAIGIFLLLSILRANRTYSEILLRSFRVRFWRGSPLMIVHKKILDYVTDSLKSKNTDDVVYFLRILQESYHPSYPKHLLKALKHPNADVRIFALMRVERMSDVKKWNKPIETVFEKDTDDRVRGGALAVLIKFAGDTPGTRTLDKYLPYLDDKSLKVGAMTGFLKLKNNYSLLAMDGLQKLAHSKRISDNLTALHIMTDTPNTGYVRLLLPLLQHADKTVAATALTAAGVIRHAQTLPFIFAALDDFDLKEHALSALKTYGKGAFPPLEKLLDQADASPVRQRALIQFLGSLSSGEGKQILLRSLGIPNQKMRKTVMETLLADGIIWIQRGAKKNLRAGIRRDITRFEFWTHFMKNFAVAPTHETEESFKFLRQSIVEDMNDTRALIIYQLELLKPHKLFHKAAQILMGDAYAHYPTAAGVVQDFLSTHQYRRIKPILMHPVPTDPTNAVQHHSVPQISASVASLLTEPPFILPDWVRANALYACRALGDKAALPAVETALKETNPLVLEAAVWALPRLEKNKSRQHALLLNLPTSLLTHPSLAHLLK